MAGAALPGLSAGSSLPAAKTVRQQGARTCIGRPDDGDRDQHAQLRCSIWFPTKFEEESRHRRPGRPGEGGQGPSQPNLESDMSQDAVNGSGGRAYDQAEEIRYRDDVAVAVSLARKIIGHEHSKDGAQQHEQERPSQRRRMPAAVIILRRILGQHYGDQGQACRDDKYQTRHQHHRLRRPRSPATRHRLRGAHIPSSRAGRSSECASPVAVVIRQQRAQAHRQQQEEARAECAIHDLWRHRR